VTNGEATVGSAPAGRRARAISGAHDRILLLKPRVMSLVVFTGGVGIGVAPGHIGVVQALMALACMAGGAAACGALNMWYDADIDALMQRTASRPIPRGRINPTEALVIGCVLAVLSVAIMAAKVNAVAALLLALTIGFYVFVYTSWLKRRTPQNIVIGGISGAIPPMIGWAATTGGVEAGSLALFLIIFLWTPPHFWALALAKSHDYQRAGVPMLPVVAGPEHTRRAILAYSLLLVPASLLPALIGTEGWLYVAVAAALGVVLLQRAWALYRTDEDEAMLKAAYRLFGYSIFYLFALFVALLAGVR
jgi:protoheme IX farnesyltransferase